MHMSRIDGSLIWTHHYYRVLIYRYILMHPGWMTQGTVRQCLLSGDLVGREPRTTLCSVTTLVFIYNQMKMCLCFKYLFIAFISAVFPLAGLFPCIYASWVLHPFILSVCSLLVLSFCEPSPDAFQACGEKLWLRLVSWLEGCASNCVPGPGERGTCLGAAHPCPWPLQLCLFLKVCEEEASCWSRVSLQCRGQLQPKGPCFISVDTCNLAKVRACAAAAGESSSGPRCARDSLRRLCWWQIFHWFCWLPQATLTSEPILLLSASFISIFLPTVDIYKDVLSLPLKCKHTRVLLAKGLLCIYKSRSFWCKWLLECTTFMAAILFIYRATLLHLWNGK